MDARRRPGAGVLPPPGGAHPTKPKKADPSPTATRLSAEEVCRDYAPRVYRMARRMVRSEVDAEDLTQDVLLKVVRNLPAFRGESALPTWLHRITVNTALSHRRKHVARRRQQTHSLDDPQLAEARAQGPQEQLLGRETRQLIDRAIAALPAACRSVFVLADVEELPNAVIAERLGLSLPAVKSRLHRARRILRRTLARHFEPPFSGVQGRFSAAEKRQSLRA